MSDARSIYLEIMGTVCAKPAMYVGEESIYLVSSYLDGVALGIEKSTGTDPLIPFQRWCECRYGICGSSWGWPRILHHSHETEAAAIRALPTLYQTAMDEMPYQDESELSAWLKRREPSGNVPKSTHTPHPFASVYDMLDVVRTRDSMMIRDRSLDEIETLVDGYFTCVQMHRVRQNYGRFRPFDGQDFLAWLYERTGWSASSGFAHAINSHVPDPDEAFDRFFELLDEYRESGPGI